MEKNVVVSTDDPDLVELPDDKVERGNNNDLESSSSKHEKHQPNDTKIEINQLEEILGVSLNLENVRKATSQCCIYKVPKDLRKINEEAYTPKVISIGPFHHGKSWLSEMEKHKLKYVLEFLKREGGLQKLKEFKKFIVDNEKLIRNYYQEHSNDLTRSEFVNMIVCDAVFIIELFLNNAVEKDAREHDYFLDVPYVRVSITRDLELLENQLPYFVLKSLFEKGDFTSQGQFLTLSKRFFFGNFPIINNQIQPCEIQHFTDLRRYFLLMYFPPRDQERRNFLLMDFPPRDQERRNFLLMDLPTVTELHRSGVKFKNGNNRIQCELVPRAMQIPGFKGCLIPIPFRKELELRIPLLEIDDLSECLYRNVIALEQCHYPYETHICNFVVLMNFLVKTKKDVNLLVDQRIIFSCLVDNAAIVKMFKNLSLQITASPSAYHDIYAKLKAYYDNRRVRWNRNKATLKSVYFRDIWTGTGTVAAAMLLVLTFIQAVCSILSLL